MYGEGDKTTPGFLILAGEARHSRLVFFIKSTRRHHSLHARFSLVKIPSRSCTLTDQLEHSCLRCLS